MATFFAPAPTEPIRPHARPRRHARAGTPLVAVVEVLQWCNARRTTFRCNDVHDGLAARFTRKSTSEKNGFEARYGRHLHKKLLAIGTAMEALHRLMVTLPGACERKNIKAKSKRCSFSLELS